jgi:uncharacterized membrane protein
MFRWWEYGAPLTLFSTIFGPIIMIVVAVLAVVIIEWLLRSFGPDRQSRTQEKAARDFVEENLTHSGIDRTEHKEHRQVASGS